ncbi:MAG: hypothetical protein JXB13_15665 [Phycisphaerae bacterium]|nr:hypothetical protein [Phycisphaerae bacterium]
MRRRSRIRRVAKWTGLLLCAVVLVAWGISIWHGFAFRFAGQHFDVDIAIYGERLHCTAAHLTEAHTQLAGATGFGWVDTSVRDHQWSLIGRYARYGVSCSNVSIPLGLVLLPFAVPTVILWHRDRRPPKGNCQSCGYDLTGNVTGVCPECGEVVARTAAGGDRQHEP